MCCLTFLHPPRACQEPGELWLTAMVAAELMFGVTRLPETPRKQRLAQAVSAMLEEDFVGKLFAFDLAAAASNNVI